MKPEPAVELLTQKALAAKLGVSTDWIRAMRRQGFPMPGGRGFLSDAVEWLRGNPSFKVSAALGKASKRRNLRAI